MPEDFDPAWEYYAPDPETAECQSGPEVGGFAVLGIEDRDRTSRIHDRDYNPGHRFGTRDRRQPFRRECAACGRSYRPWDEEQVYCSNACHGGARTPVRDPALFARMWDGGANVADMADFYGITPTVVYRIRKRLGLTPRRPGNHAANRNPPMREPLPDRRRSWTQKAKIPDFAGKPQTFYLTCGEYPDGRLGEIWVEAQKENTFTRGVLGAMARSVSVALQSGTPPSEVVKMLRSLAFPPAGPVHAPGSDVRMCSSVADWVAQEIENVYVTGVSSRPARGDGHGGGTDGVGGESGEPGAEIAGAG